jgi:hypothetical protein
MFNDTSPLHLFDRRCPSILIFSIELVIETKQDTLVRFEAFTAVTMKDAVFWDIKTQFVLHRGHITSPLQSPTD